MSLKSFFKRFLPEPHVVRNHQHLRHFGDLLHDPNLWHLNRHSSAGGVATGLFCAFIPLPIHMVVAAALSIVLRVNLPLAVIFTWITNPFTFAPIFIFAYKFGALLLRSPAEDLAFELSFTWFGEKFIHIWEPLLLGCLLLATTSAITGYTGVRLLWRLMLVRKWEERRKRMNPGV
jgi:uncharacterized protein (DUF2062 family)